MIKKFITKLRQVGSKGLYKKLMLALYGLCIQSLRLHSKFCTRIILYATELSPSREILRKSLNDFKKSLNGLASARMVIKTKKQTLEFCTAFEGCKLFSEEITIFDTSKAIVLGKPKVFNKDFTVAEEYACIAYLPDTYLAQIKDVRIFAGTDLIIAQNLILYDEIKKEEIGKYAIKSAIVSEASAAGIVVMLPTTKRWIKTGIHLTKDHSINYFHWIIECLPKLSLVVDLPNETPLLVDDFLPKQFHDALDMLNAGKRKIIKIKREESYIVKKLYYPSRLSIVHDNYDVPVYDKDVVYSEEGIRYVRDSILGTVNNNEIKSTRKIFISRKNSSYRQLVNSIEIENLLVSKGFEIVFPENLSFLAQVKIFSQAKVIIGQSGAGMANIIFAPKTANILMMLSDAPGSNLQLFHALAEAVGINLEYIIGKTTVILENFSPHSDFSVDINLLTNYLDKESY